MLALLERQGYYPQHCVWELTLACNVRCRHCGSLAGAPRPDELSFDEQLRVADELVALGCEKVSLSGGEPTLHARWADLGAHLTRAGVRVNLVSNGWRFGTREADLALGAGLENVAFSLDGLEASHDQVRGAGSFLRALDAIRVSRSVGLEVGVITHLNRWNAHELDALRELLVALEVRFWQVQLGVPTGQLRGDQELVLSRTDLLWLIPRVAELRRTPLEPPRLLVAETLGYYGRYERALRDEGTAVPCWIGCRAGCRVIGIESHGDVKGCLSLPSSRQGVSRFVEGNLRRASLAEIWGRPDAFAFNRQFSPAQLGGFCARCRFGDVCRAGCSWLAWSQTGDPLSNPSCFYAQAVIHDRLDLLEEDPTEGELAAADAIRRGALGY